MRKPGKKTVLIITGVAAPIVAAAVFLPKLLRKAGKNKYARA